MSGTIGVIANDAGRYTLFSIALTHIKHPSGTTMAWARSTDIVRGRTALVQRMLASDSEWLLFLDDDHVFPTDLLTNLLAHEQPIVGSLYLRRQVPFAPLAFSERLSDTTYQAIDLSQLPEEGLLRVQAVGTSGLLVRREVFEAIETPWFEYGATERWDASEDIIFCEKAQEKGFPVYVDLGSRLGHMTPTAVWPSWVDQEWVVGFSVADGLSLFCPIEKAAEAQAPADAVRR